MPAAAICRLCQGRPMEIDTQTTGVVIGVGLGSLLMLYGGIL